ncbi:MAG: DHHA1 domain-containing protein [Methanosarcina thermophila]|uniref:Single-stranded DNA-specific exonuclease, DHH superfamily, may be involved in DNA replication intiation n=3 Tax=Methanosarcina thermophila TaxID=2210 RepID=A0A1I7A746_METTE|nr:DHH family phosphoesterase [Methanosarcina thermophila]ALK05549.1 MAG: phosphoesterase [Methanosarcina sp. 795]AKB11821.1 Single-stranded-DNA-specific exonuclease RecJ [Methanosarcina thermophila TM-1]AKB14985.1 Single-stranded-DNA-specific exonuclease RecJ [Methanosarcina thermophila CHTI-55]NLU56766.1 DHH family phosphoesterase [Methanosarcina thermophila]SFT70765.1 Single-stranded DNA-specific exonuclease, DHH superfamily, may be involved in DNA replication intiation [Methanosarcina ther
MSELEKLINLAKNAAEKIRKYRFARVVSHNDADGLTSAGIMAQALLRAGICFQISIVGRLDEAVIEEVNRSISVEEVVIFCDMGSGQPELIGKVAADVIVLDHHQPVGQSPAKAIVNAHLAGIDGATDISASGTCYLVARELSADNIDLAGLALAGAVGDKQLFRTANAFILGEALKAGVVSIRKGLKVGDGDLVDVLAYTIEPFMDITGYPEKTKEFLDLLELSGRIEDLSEEEVSRLANAVALKLVRQASPEAIEAVIGEVLLLNRELVRNVYDFNSILSTCGKQKIYGLAISLCLKDREIVNEALSLKKEYEKKLVLNIRENVEKIRKGENIWYVITADAISTGSLASTVVRYLHPELPFICVNESEGILKVSARGTRELVSKGLDLAFALREAASAVGGSGGGHNVASGAVLPIGSEEEFLSIADRIIGEQLRKPGKGKAR